jgi:hypothetical protein
MVAAIIILAITLLINLATLSMVGKMHVRVIGCVGALTDFAKGMVKFHFGADKTDKESKDGYIDEGKA